MSDGTQPLLGLLDVRPSASSGFRHPAGLNHHAPRDPIMRRDRKRAIALRALDATMLINSRFSQANLNMTAAQIEQVQRVLDAAVVNPVVRKEYQEAYEKSIIGRVGNQFAFDPKLSRQADKVFEGMIAVSESDRHIRLNFRLMMMGNALTPTTDNPDEAKYLNTIPSILEQRGVWLRLGQPWVRNPNDYSSTSIDPRRFDVWLSLGYDGDTIPSKDGSLTREALLGTTAIGAGYYEAVHDGPVQRALKKEVRRLEGQIDAGLEEHDRLIKRKRDAFPGVAEVSDFFGGADLPPRSIWEHPNKLLTKALEVNVGGNVSFGQPFLLVAAIATRNNAQLLATYAEKSAAGAGAAVTILKVAKTAGQIAEAGLALTGIVGLARGATTVATGTAASSSVDAAAERVVARYIAKNPELAADLNKVRWVPGPKGTILGSTKGGHSSGIGTGGWHSGW